MSTTTINSLILTKPLDGVRDTGPAKLPAVVIPRPGDDAGIVRAIQQLAERAEVREGSRGNPYERVITAREFDGAVKVLKEMVPIVEAITGKRPDGGPMSGEASAMIDRFIKSIMDTKLFKDLMKRLDDPSRFDDLPAEIREVLLSSIAEEARKRGADITRIEKKFQDANRSLAFTVDTVTAAVRDSAAGVREVRWAVAEVNHAQAGFIRQIEASLGNYYQDGRPGRVLLEQQMYATADRVQGLAGQITFKIQAGGALAGFGLASSENTAGAQTSAFIVSADKFAVVGPNYAPPTSPVYERDAAGNIVYVNGQPKVAYNQILAHEIQPNQGGIPFGIDQYGIYLNNNVYVRGNMRVEGTGGRTLIQGLRGSVIALQEVGSWSDTQARNMVWTRIGNFGSAGTNNHLVIGDMVTIGSTTRYWNGAAWIDPGTVFRGDMIVDGTLGASKINTHGLTIKNQAGQVVFQSGVSTGLPASFVSGLGSLATKDGVTADDVSGLGSLARRSKVYLGSDSTTDISVDGTDVFLDDFLSRFRKATKENIATFISHAAIGSALIDEAAIQRAHIDYAQIDTLRIAGGSVTSMRMAQGGFQEGAAGSSVQGATGALAMVVTPHAAPSGVVLTGFLNVMPKTGDGSFTIKIYRGDYKLLGETYFSALNGYHTSMTVVGYDDSPANGNNWYAVWVYNHTSGPGSNVAFEVAYSRLTMTGGMR